MKKEFFSNLEKIIYTEQKDEEKFEEFLHFYDDFKRDLFVYDKENPPLLKVNHHQNLLIKHPTRIRRVKIPNSDESLAKLVHSIAHIEHCAIFLALDSTYRFRKLPKEYYANFLSVADDEIKHFRLLNKALKELGFEYGSFAVHNSLEAALFATAHSLKYRMSVVHRGLEAKGLDANPFVVAKLNQSRHAIKSLLNEILEIILNDEIRHVSYGDIWFKFDKNSEDFLSICKKFKEFVVAGKVLNKEARLKAGFSENELEELENFYQKELSKKT